MAGVSYTPIHVGNMTASHHIHGEPVSPLITCREDWEGLPTCYERGSLPIMSPPPPGNEDWAPLSITGWEGPFRLERGKRQKIDFIQMGKVVVWGCWVIKPSPRLLSPPPGTPQIRMGKSGGLETPGHQTWLPDPLRKKWLGLKRSKLRPFGDNNFSVCIS